MMGIVLASGCTGGSAPAPSSTSARASTSTSTEPTTASTAPRTTTSTTIACDVHLASWPVPRRLAQLLLVGGEFGDLPGSRPAAAAGVGGFVLFGQPAAGSGPSIHAGIESLLGSARDAGAVAPWMATDEEGGSIARLSDVIGALPSPRTMAAEWTTAQIETALTVHGVAMRQLGLSVDLAPVLDTAAATHTIAEEDERSFSDDPAVAASDGIAFAAGLRGAGILPVAKHFPGFGHASANTDLGPAVAPPLAQLEAHDLIPFERAIAAGIPTVMVMHASVPGLTGTTPASLSPATYAFLRGTLHFDGVAMTDSLAAGAITATGQSEERAAVTAVKAGADMVMIAGDSWSQVLGALEQQVASGGLSLARVDASVARILTVKGFHPCAA